MNFLHKVDLESRLIKHRTRRRFEKTIFLSVLGTTSTLANLAASSTSPRRRCEGPEVVTTFREARSAAIGRLSQLRDRYNLHYHSRLQLFFHIFERSTQLGKRIDVILYVKRANRRKTKNETRSRAAARQTSASFFLTRV